MFGFETGKGEHIRIRDIQYIGEIKNEYLSFDYYGLPPSIIKLLSISASFLKKDAKTGNAMSESVPQKDKNTFKHFSSFMANNQTYLIPLDSKHFKDSLITEELLHHIMHGR